MHKLTSPMPPLETRIFISIILGQKSMPNPLILVLIERTQRKRKEKSITNAQSSIQHNQNGEYKLTYSYTNKRYQFLTVFFLKMCS